MATSTITFKRRVGAGALTNADEVVLASPPDVGNFGVRRVDTGDVHTASGSGVPVIAAGTYEKVLAGLLDDVTYEYWLRVTTAGVTKYVRGTVRKGSASVVDPGVVSNWHSSQAALEDKFGKKNIKIWSNLDGDQDILDASRVERALSYAHSEVEASFMPSPYKIPLEIADASPTILVVRDWATWIAGNWLYSSRPKPVSKVSGRMQVEGPYDADIRAVYADMGKYRVGEKFLDATRSSAA